MLTLVYEIAALRLRQRRILKILNESKVSEWNGAIAENDPELERLVKEISDRFAQEQRDELGKGDSPS
jgi:hypothetical protein